MRIVENNWKVLASLFPGEWQQMAWDFRCSRATAWVSIARRVVAYADTTCGKGLVVALVRAKLERWTDVSDVALLTLCATAIRSSHHPNGRIQFLKLALKWARHHPDTNSIVSLSGLR